MASLFILMTMVIFLLHFLILYISKHISSPKIVRISEIILRTFDYFAIILMITFLIFMITNSIHTTSDADLSDRIVGISRNLSKVSTELSSIQQELEERIEFVENLKAEAEVAEDMISLTDEQVSAIQSKLNQELSSSGRQSLIQGILISAFFFILGYVVNWLKTKSKEKFADNRADTFAPYSDEEISAALNLLDSLKNKDNSQSKKD